MKPTRRTVRAVQAALARKGYRPTLVWPGGDAPPVYEVAPRAGGPPVATLPPTVEALAAWVRTAPPAAP